MNKSFGILVAVLGPDGAGKSTLIDQLLVQVPGSYRQHVRPRLFGKRDDPNTSPHGHAPYGTAKSLLKLAYLWADYVAGYFLKTRPLLASGRVCISDRYFHDLLIDPLRYRYSAPLLFARLAASLAPQPDLFLVLLAPSDVIQERRSEISLPECKRQLTAYIALAGTNGSARMLDATGTPGWVAQQARELVNQCLATHRLGVPLPRSVRVGEQAVVTATQSGRGGAG